MAFLFLSFIFSNKMCAEVFIYIFLIFICTSIAIDENENVGYCIDGFTVDVDYYMTELEGIWFPQYRPKNENNHKYTCHTLYEQMDKEDGIYKLFVETYLTIDNVVDKESHEVTYTNGPKRGIFMDKEEIKDGVVNIYNYILKLTKDYRVRYVCTDYKSAITKHPAVYIETRNLTTNLNIIKEAVNVIRSYGLKNVALERIYQKNCTRPLSYKGYENEDKS